MKTRAGSICQAVCLAFVACLGVRSIAQDTIPPVFVDLSLQQDTVQNGDTVIMILHAFDDISGINMISIQITDEAQDPDFSLYHHVEWYSGNDLYELHYVVGQWVTSGTRTITSIVITDNEQNIYMSGQVALGSFYVLSNSPDTVAPVAGSIEIEPDTVPDGEIVTATMSVTDTLSGFEFCNFTLMDINNETIQYYWANFAIDDTTLSSETLLNVIGVDTYALDLEMPAGISTGLYYFTVDYYDRAGNFLQSVSETFFVQSDFTTSLSMSDGTLSATVFPNPTSGIIMIYLDQDVEAIASILTVDGKVVHERQVLKNSTIQIQHLPPGPYLLRLQTGSSDRTLKIIRSLD